ncbi:MAG TPA: hypothetical protein VLF40_00195 [Candidatus Saccharimonadales bacterium]|nr:hypothetical protein [Candidatus Saccharimonadales bacterium]
MVRKQGDGDFTQLQAENERLRLENERLQRSMVPAPKVRHPYRAFLAGLFLAFAVALLVAGNLLFWVGNTIVKTDRFDAATAPVIRNKEVQTALASYTTTQIFKNVDTTAVVQNALPSQAEFLAPTIADQLQSKTQSTLQAILARPQFEDHWNKLLSNAHAKFIDTVKRSGGDGVINLNELYQQLSSALKDTKLSFLADKQLPPKVGSVRVASGGNIRALHNLIVHIDTWRTLAILLFLLCTALAIWLARRKRRMVALLAVYSAVGLLASLIAVRIAREVVAGKVQPQYADAARATFADLFHPFVIQTATLLVLFAVVGVVLWLTGSSRGALFLRGRINLVFSGKLHSALFGGRENAFTIWVARYKPYLEWTVVAIAALLLLITRVTLKALLGYAIVTVIVVLVIELLAAPSQPSRV